jgi:hypothetical protein
LVAGIDQDELTRPGVVEGCRARVSWAVGIVSPDLRVVERVGHVIGIGTLFSHPYASGSNLQARADEFCTRHGGLGDSG